MTSLSFNNSVVYCSHPGYQSISLCPLCEQVGYCSSSCSTAHQARHRTECRLASDKEKRRAWPHRAWYVARAIIRLAEEGDGVRERINDKKSRAFRDLVDRE